MGSAFLSQKNAFIFQLSLKTAREGNLILFGPEWLLCAVSLLATIISGKSSGDGDTLKPSQTTFSSKSHFRE
jgi:hypothetical protein